MHPNFGTPKIINFPFVPNGKFIILGAPILKHITVIMMQKNCKMKDSVVMKQSSRKQIFESKTLHFRIKIK